MNTIHIHAASAALAAAALAGCLGPRVSDVTADAPPIPIAPSHILPMGSSVPSIADNPELANQIITFCGLSAQNLTAGVVTRSDGKAAGAAAKYWNFGPVTLKAPFLAPVAPLYVLADEDGSGGYIPRTDHPSLIESIPGAPAYSPIRRIYYVPVTSTYAGELLTSVEALAEALERGLIKEPRAALNGPSLPTEIGLWRNMPVVPTGMKLEVGPTAADQIAATEVYGLGYRVELFPLGGALGLQPLKANAMPMGDESRLLSGVPTGTPLALPTTLDAQPVFQYGIPATAPTTDFNYTPIVTELDVRLASVDTNTDGIPDTVLPSAVSSDAALFRRSGFCFFPTVCRVIQGFVFGTVASYTVTSIVSNKQIQFAEGSP